MQVIKTWSRGRPGNEAIICSIPAHKGLQSNVAKLVSDPLNVTDSEWNQYVSSQHDTVQIPAPLFQPLQLQLKV